MDTVATFADALEGQSTVHRTPAADFGETLQTAIEEPAVGTPLPFEDVSLDATAVETDFDADGLAAARTGVTPAGTGIADYGTVTVASTADGAELVSLYVDRHVAVLAASDLVPDMASGFDRFDDDVSGDRASQVLATGPSATADMGDLVLGVHGPDETHVIVLEDR